MLRSAVRLLQGLALAALPSACAGTSVSVTEMDPGVQVPALAPKYDSALTAIQHGDFGHVAGRADATAEERDLAAALLDVEMGRFNEADRALGRLADTGSERVRQRAAEAHVCILFHESRWADLLRRYPDAEASANVIPLVRAWANAPPERVTFTAPSATLPATLEDVDMPFVEVHVGDRAYRFLLDTGATFTLISSEVAEAAGMAPSSDGADIGTATTRRLSVKPAVLPRLTVGNAVFENHPCVVADPEDLNFKFLLLSFLRLDGVLGWNAIQRLDLDVDFRVPEVTIRAPRSRAGERNLFWLGKPLVRARLADGIPILAGLDTGASASSVLPLFFEVLPREYVEKTTGKTSEGTERVWGAGGDERMPSRTVEKLSVVLDRHLLEFRNLESGRTTLSPIFIPVLQFGNDIALKGRMRIDFANGVLELGQ
jgi:hypothetical protein